MTTTILAFVVLLPLLLLSCWLAPPLRQAIRTLLPIAPAPGLAAALLSRGTTVELPPLQIHLALTDPGAILLGAASILWIVVSPMLRRATDDRFVAWWLLTMAGSLGVFIAADLVSFYLLFSVVSLSAYGLIAAGSGPGVGRAVSVYVSLAVLGEAFLLLAFILLAVASPTRSLLIADAVAALPGSPWRDLTIACLILGFGLKIGLVPGHVWMPLTYPEAPLPAAAVMSGAAVKSGVIGLILFLPLSSALPAWGHALAVIGFTSALYGVFVGLTQRDPRAVLAYSSVSQMGLVGALAGMALTTGSGAAAAMAIAFYGAHHVLVKGGLFAALPLLGHEARAERHLLLPVAIIALSLAGLPLTGGYVAKAVIKPVLGDGLAGTMGMVASAGSTLLMLHFLRRLEGVEAAARWRSGAALAWWTLAGAATALPWIVLRPATGSTPGAALSIGALAEAAAPIIASAVVTAALSASRIAIPTVPSGDVAGLADRGLAPLSRVLGKAMARTDETTRQWPVACIALLVIALVLGATLAAGP
jgi:formate hydrogenlyase subunit 3/multisubunit Na+/H+ antiporter MnhD subunit